LVFFRNRQVRFAYRIVKDLRAAWRE